MFTKFVAAGVFAILFATSVVTSAQVDNPDIVSAMSATAIVIWSAVFAYYIWTLASKRAFRNKLASYDRIQ